MKAVFFDLDNTLIDFMRMKRKACKAAVEAMLDVGLKMDREEAYERLMKTYFDFGLESDRAFTEFLKRIGQFDHKILAAAINAYLKTKTDFVVPYPNVKSILEILREKGIILIVVTDAPKTKAYQRLLLLGIEPYFAFVVGFEDTESKKQTGLPFRFALKKLKNEFPGTEASQVLVVGDSVERDIQPAKKLGFRTALCKYGQTDKENEKADYELADIGDLIKLV